MRDHAKGGALTEVTFFILLALRQPRHGYAVMQFIEEETQGRLVLGAGTLYGALNHLCEKGWIEPLAGDPPRQRRYQLTPLGQEAARAELARLKALTALARRHLEGDAP